MSTAARGRAPAFASMAVPDFRRFFLGQSLSSTGAWFRTPALALVAVALTRPRVGMMFDTSRLRRSRQRQTSHR